MTDKSNSPEPTPNNKDISIDQTFVPGGLANASSFNVDITVPGAPSPDDDDNPPTADKLRVDFDVNATFVPKKTANGDEYLESKDDFAATLVGTPTSDEDWQENDSDQEHSGSVTPVSKVDSDSTAIADERIVDTDATMIVEDSAARARDDGNQQGTEFFPSPSEDSSAGKGSGSGISKFGSGSKMSSQIWSRAGKSSLDELISIRTRSVSGTEQFTPSDDGDFEIIEKLAEGGMGVVYVALQKSLNRQLAIKTLKSGKRSRSATAGKSDSARVLSREDRQKREMFLSEALVTANLVHPNIIPIHELAETDEGMPYYVMKQVHGVPWNKRIRDMPLDENLDVMHKVCDAVAYAHHHGVINRDLKPENIMLGEFGEVLVLDWGLAVPAPHAAEQNFRSPVASFGAGTPAYMSPELWIGPPEAIGECSDIYLLGGILFEAITGQPPHDFPKVVADGSRTDVWKAIDGVLRENQIRATTASGELLDIALKAMRTVPAERFGSVLEFQFAVRNYQRHEESRRLSSRATELIQSKTPQTHDYHTYQTAAALFEESLRTWAQNDVARIGLRATRLQYAQRAAAKGDYDLGMQVAARETDEDFVALSKKLRTAKQIRSGVKWAAMAAMFCVVALGAKSIYDNGIITNLNAEVSVRKAEANDAIAKADEAKVAAVSAMDDAKTARENAAAAQQDAELSRIVATESSEKARLAKQDAIEALAAADASRSAAESSKREAAKAIAAANTANRKVVEATAMLAKAEEDTARAREQQLEAETASRVAQVEIQSQSIRGLALNQNYADALREIDRLLSGELLPRLPEEIRKQRSAELQAQRAQLMRRVRQSPDPVQTQTISPDRSRIAFGDSAGLVTVMQCPGESLTWSADGITQKQFRNEITALRFVDSEKLIVASGSELFFWNLRDPDPVALPGHSQTIQSLDLNGSLLLTADESGRAVVRNLDNGQTIATLNLRTQLRDVAFIPGSNDFICAGSRGGESADILAYRLSNRTQEHRPERLGQLRMSRLHNEPPQRISISPDGLLLAMSNSTNGDLVVLRAATPAEGSGNLFPFEHPSDLEATADITWRFVAHERPINDIEWSQDGLKCLTASDDRTIGVWSRSNNARSILTRETVLRGHGARVTRAQFLDEAANQIASSSADRLNRLWDLETLDEDQHQIRSAFHLAESVPRNPTQHRALLQLTGKYQLTAWSDESVPATNQAGSVRTHQIVSPKEIKEDAEPAAEVMLNAHPRLHRGSVQAIRFSDDGEYLVTGAADGSIVIWDVKTAQPVARPVTSRQAAGEQFHEGHQFNVSHMSIIGPAGTLLATAGYDGSLRLWNMDPASLRIGVQRQVIIGLGLVNTFAASSNGEFLVTSAIQETENPQPGECRLWNLGDLLQSANTSPAALLSGIHRSEVTAVAVSHDNKQIATGGRDGIIAIWDARTARPLTSLRGHAKNTIVTSLQWLPDGTLMSSGLDGQLTHWRIEADASSSAPLGRLIRILTFHREKTPIEEMHVSPDGQQILTLSVETDRATQTTQHHLDVWSPTALKSLHRVQLATVAGKQPDAITSAEWSPDGQRLLVCVDGIVQILDSQSWEILRVFSAGPGACTEARLAEQLSRITGNELLVTLEGTAAHLWNLDNGEQLASFRGPFPVSTVGFLSDEKRRFVVAGGASLRIFDGREDLLSFGRPLFRTREGAASQITSVDVCPTDPSVFAAASANGMVVLWRWHSATQFAEEVRVLKPTGHPVSCCRWSKDGSLLLAVGLEGLLTICTADGSSRQEFQVESNQAIDLFAGEFSPDGQHLVVAGQIAQTSESKAWVVKIPAGFGSTRSPLDVDVNELLPETMIVCTFSGHQAGGISSVSFIPDSPYIVSGGNDGAMILWNWNQPLPGAGPMAYEAFRFMTAGKITAHTAPITDIAVARSGRIASSGADGKVSLWRLPIRHD